MVEREDPHDRVKITKAAVRTGGSKVGVLPKGKKVQLEALMNGLMLVSGNDAAVALAPHTSGGVGRFVRLMNRRADRLGLSLHALLYPARPRGPGKPFVRRGPRDPRARGPLEAPDPQDRAPRARDLQVPDQGRAPVPL